MKDINEVRLRGRIGSIKFFGQDNSIASISLATNDGYKGKNGWVDITTWHRVKAFSSRPGMIDFSLLEKGQIAEVSGRIVNNRYKDGNGNDRESMEIEASDIAIINEFKRDNSQGGRSRNDYDEEF